MEMPHTDAQRRIRLPGSVVEITFPDEKKIRSRRVVTRGRATSTGKFPSWKMGRMVQWESRHELNAIIWLDTRPDVERIQEQPCVIRYILDGEERLHYPDLLIQLAGRDEFWEIKSADTATDPVVRRRAQLMEQELPLHGYQYKLVSSDELPKVHALQSMRKLLRWGRKPVRPERREGLRQLWLTAGPITWGALRDAQFGVDGRHDVCRLILEGHVTIPIDQPITDASPLSWTMSANAPGRV